MGRKNAAEPAALIPEPVPEFRLCGRRPRTDENGTDIGRIIWTIDGDAAVPRGKLERRLLLRDGDNSETAANTPPCRRRHLQRHHGNVGRMVGAFGVEKQ